MTADPGEDKARAGADRILVVEDDPDMRALLVDTLAPVATRHGLEIAAVASVAAARRYIQFKPVRLIVSDIRMPVESGLSLGEWLRADSRLGHMPVIYVTAFDDPQTEAAVSDLGGADLLIKPFAPDHLRRMADTLLMAGRHRLGRGVGNVLPDAQDMPALGPRDQHFVDQVRQVMQVDPAAAQRALVKATGHSPRNFQRNFERLFGQTYREFSGQARMARARELLLQGKAVAEVAESCGYNSVSAFSRRFRQSQGMAPRDWVASQRAPQD